MRLLARVINESPPISPSERLLCGPGPTNVDPAALEAMSKPMLGHLDPELHEILLDVVDMLRRVYRAQGGLVLPLQATGTSGMEAGLANLVEPGETVIVGSSGYLRHPDRRDSPALRRQGVEVTADWGEHVPNERLLAALDDRPDARLLAIVHGETSTGCEHPLEATRRRDARARHPADGGLRHHPGRASSWTSTDGGSTTPTRAPRSAWPHRRECPR
jgi:alanine-glyoxylate transaminase/serine-glyoxylate transaminase/serine-pyruvate transaminase